MSVSEEDQLWYTRGGFIQPLPKHGKAPDNDDSCAAAELLVLLVVVKKFDFMAGFAVANDSQSPKFSSKLPFFNIIVQKYQGSRFSESVTAHRDPKYLSFSTAYRSAFERFVKELPAEEVIGNGSPVCSSLSASVTWLLTLHVLKPATAEFKAMQTTKTELREDEEEKGGSP
jgi:hypothetical protein